MTPNDIPSTHSFTLFLRGPDVLCDDHMDALHTAGCDDALFGERDGAQYAAFDREARSFGDALRTAIEAVTKAVDGLSITRIEPDEMVTMAAIAQRAGVSRESVRLLSTGQRGPGGFPSPIAYADRKTRLWHWPDVAHWLSQHGKAKIAVDETAADLVGAMNAALALRAHARRLRGRRDRSLVAETLGDDPFT